MLMEPDLLVSCITLITMIQSCFLIVYDITMVLVHVIYEYYTMYPCYNYDSIHDLIIPIQER
jgi:hypothetical protein